MLEVYIPIPINLKLGPQNTNKVKMDDNALIKVEDAQRLPRPFFLLQVNPNVLY